MAARHRQSLAQKVINSITIKGKEVGLLRTRGKRFRRKLIRTRPLIPKRTLRSLASTKSSNAFRTYRSRFYKNHDAMGISLFFMAVVGLAVGAVMFSVAVGIVLVAYILLRRKSSSTEEAPA